MLSDTHNGPRGAQGTTNGSPIERTSQLGPTGTSAESHHVRLLGPLGPDGNTYNPNSFWGVTRVLGPSAAPLYEEISKTLAQLTQQHIQEETSLIASGRTDPPAIKAMYTMAGRCINHAGVILDVNRALELYEKAASYGHAGAAYALSRIYMLGNQVKGLDKNVNKAADYINRFLPIAEQQGNKFDDANYRNVYCIEQLQALKQVAAAQAFRP